jgi:hypothetical protein
MLMRPKHPLDRLLTLKTSGVHDLMGSLTTQPAEEMRDEHWDVAGGQSRAFYPFVTTYRASKLGLDILNEDAMTVVILPFSNCGLLL